MNDFKETHALGDDESIFPLICMLNHSNDFNCSLYINKTNFGPTARILSIKNIYVGEELTISYYPLLSIDSIINNRRNTRNILTDIYKEIKNFNEDFNSLIEFISDVKNTKNEIKLNYLIDNASEQEKYVFFLIWVICHEYSANFFTQLLEKKSVIKKFKQKYLTNILNIIKLNQHENYSSYSSEIINIYNQNYQEIIGRYANNIIGT